MIYLILFSRTIDLGCFCRFSGCLHGNHGGPGEGGLGSLARGEGGVRCECGRLLSSCGKGGGHQ